MQKSLPVLEYAADELYDDVDLSNTLLIACQHLLGTTGTMFSRFIDKGLKPENVHVIGKCYSTSQQAKTEIEEFGINVSEDSDSFDSHRSFDDQFQSYIEKFIAKIARERDLDGFEKVIVLDDGGELLTYAHDFVGHHENVVGIEQTTSGVRKVESTPIGFPIINIARSEAKLEFESPLIGQMIARKIQDYLSGKGLLDSQILLIGKGYIGRHIQKQLESDLNITVADKENEKGELSKEFKQHIDRFEVIVGATGESVLNPGDFGDLKQGVHLISTSSSDREFSAAYLRRNLNKYENCHKDISAGNGLTLVNGGFPINFDGGYHSLPPEEIQLTRALLFSGVCEAATNKFTQNELVSLDEEVQNELVGVFKSE